MAQRSAAKGILTFGTARMPIKLFVSSSKETIKFKRLTADGNITKDKATDAKNEKEVDVSCCLFGYAVGQDEYVAFTKEERDALAGNDEQMVIENFVPEETVDSVHVEESYYVKPDLGGEAVFQALAAI
jgi:non-homologous end joining protein Ku